MVSVSKKGLNKTYLASIITGFLIIVYVENAAADACPPLGCSSIAGSQDGSWVTVGNCWCPTLIGPVSGCSPVGGTKTLKKSDATGAYCFDE